MNRGQGKRVSQVPQTKKLDEAASADHIARTAPPLVRDLIRDDPRRGIRVMQVHAAAPCQH